MHLHQQATWGHPPLAKIPRGLQHGVVSSAIHTTGMAPRKKILSSPHSHIWIVQIIYVIFGGDKGGPHLNSFIMILFEFNTHRRFGLGIRYKSRHLSNYVITEITIDLLLFSVSLVYTKINA
jgi:hypothetical protein